MWRRSGICGYRIIGECSWHHCQHLQIVHLAAQSPACKREPSAAALHCAGSLPQVVRITGLCRMLFPVAVGIRNDTTNQLAPQAELRPRAFHKCAATTYLELSEYNSNSVMRVLPECCFLEPCKGALLNPAKGTPKHFKACPFHSVLAQPRPPLRMSSTWTPTPCQVPLCEWLTRVSLSPTPFHQRRTSPFPQ